MSKSLTKILFVFFTLIYLFSSSLLPAFANISYLYDSNGNMTSDGTNCSSYNDANQLTQVTNCASGKLVATYLYDYQGNRISRKSYDVNGNLVKTTYTPTQGYETVKIASNNTTQNTAYYYVNNKLVARKNPDNSKTYYLSDHLNSVSVLTDQSGNVIEKTSYYPFGSIRSGGTQSKQLYTGQINDPETGLDYYNARYYNAHIARFTQPDDVIPNVYNPQSLNRYSYVLNNPLRYTDPSGHNAFLIGLYGFLIYALLFMPLTLPHHSYTLHSNPVIVNRASDNIKATVQGVKTLGSEAVKGAANVAQGAMNNLNNRNNTSGNNFSKPSAFDPNKWVKENFNNPEEKPGPEWKWRGSDEPSTGKGSWVRGSKGEEEVLHPDINNLKEGPHWDYTPPGENVANKIRIGPNGEPL